MYGDKIVGIVSGSKFILISRDPFFYFGAADGTDGTGPNATVESQGILLTGNDPTIHQEVEILSNFTASADALYVVSTIKDVAIKSYYVSGSYHYFTASDNASLEAGFENSGELAAATVASLGVVYVTSGTEMPKHFVELPVDAAANQTFKTERFEVSSGEGTWPTLTAEQLDLRFIGRYRMMHGVHENRPILDNHYGIISYVKEVQTSALTGGASAVNVQTTRVDEVLNFAAIQMNAGLSDIFKALAQ
jgi:hypothetical protein